MYKFIGSLICLLLLAIVASWQLFLFTVLKESGLSITGGRSHLWWATVAGISACVVGALMSYFFSRHETNKWSKVQMTPAGPPLTALGGNPFINSPVLSQFDARRWALGNRWLTEGQADDRMPMDGSVNDSGATASGQRAFARRTHQLMFKKWSQARHD